MIQELENNAVFSNEYRPAAPKKGDLAAIYENRGRKLLMSLDENGAMSLPEAELFRDYWIEPDDGNAEEKMAEKGGRLVYLYSIDDTAFYTFIYYDDKTPDFSFTGMEFLPFSFENKPLPKTYISERKLHSSWQPGITTTDAAAGAERRCRYIRRSGPADAAPADTWYSPECCLQL